MLHYKDSNGTLICAEKDSLEQPVTTIETQRQTKLLNINRKKNNYGYFKRQPIVNEKTITYLRKGNLQRETACLLIAINKALRTKYIKATIDNTQ